MRELFTSAFLVSFFSLNIKLSLSLNLRFTYYYLNLSSATTGKNRVLFWHIQVLVLFSWHTYYNTFDSMNFIEKPIN